MLLKRKPFILLAESYLCFSNKGLGFFSSSINLKIVCGAFCYQSFQFHCYDDYYIINQ